MGGATVKQMFSSVLVLVILLSFCGCSPKDTSSQSTSSVTVKMPIDSTVNGYRDSSAAKSDSIKVHSITVTEAKNAKYCANTSSKKYHKTDCYVLKNTDDENKYYSNSLTDLEKMGYKPCKRCLEN